MDFTTLIGLLAAFCTTVSYYPQLKKCWATGSAGDLSLKMFITLRRDWPMGRLRLFEKRFRHHHRECCEPRPAHGHPVLQASGPRLACVNRPEGRRRTGSGGVRWPEVRLRHDTRHTTAKIREGLGPGRRVRGFEGFVRRDGRAGDRRRPYHRACEARRAQPCQAVRPRAG